jgi:hypothetical protein
LNDEVVEIEQITFNVTNTIETNLENDSFLIPGIYQEDNIQYRIVLSNQTTEIKNINIIFSDANFSLTHNCAALKSRSKCSIIIKNNIKDVGVYNSEFIINGKTISFSMSVSPSQIVLSNSLFFNSLSFLSEDTFLIQNNCPNILASRKSCNLNISLLSGSENSVVRQIAVNGQVITLTVLKNETINQNELTISSVSNNVQIIDSGKITFKIINTKLVPQLINLSLLNQGITNCPSNLGSRKSCTYTQNISTDLFKQGAQQINFNVLGKNIFVLMNFIKTKCASDNRVSSSECDMGSNNNFMAQNIINLSEYPDAICNDGSPASFFKRNGVGSGAKRWIIHLEEGGFCGEFPLSFGSFVTYFNVCPLRRQQTPIYVSTDQDPSGYRYSGGILNGLEENNPDFYTWNHIEVRYCSSDIWSGDSSRVIANEPYVWQFKGLKILDAVMNTLKNNHGLNEATNVILSGSSAGGFGILAQGDYLKNSFLSSKDVVLLSDSSWVQNFNNLNGHNFFGLLFERNIIYLNGRPDDSCSLRLGLDNHKCFIGTEAYADLSTPTFIIQDQLDEFYLNMAYGTSICSANTSQKMLMTNLSSQLRSELSSKIGVVSPRSFSHVFLTSSRWIDRSLIDNQKSVQEIFSNWYFNKTGEKSYIADPENLDLEIFNFCNN